jgi:hypothetical protein
MMGINKILAIYHDSYSSHHSHFYCDPLGRRPEGLDYVRRKTASARAAVFPGPAGRDWNTDCMSSIKFKMILWII